MLAIGNIPEEQATAQAAETKAPSYAVQRSDLLRSEKSEKALQTDILRIRPILPLCEVNFTIRSKMVETTIDRDRCPDGAGIQKGECDSKSLIAEGAFGS